MNIAAIQLDIVWENKAANFARVGALLAAAPPGPGSLIVLPEMFASGFSMNLAATRQTDACEDEMFLAELAREHQSFVTGGVVSPAENGRGRNDSITFAPDGERLARYTKIHPFSLGGELRDTKRGLMSSRLTSPVSWRRRSFATICVSRKSSARRQNAARIFSS